MRAVAGLAASGELTVGTLLFVLMTIRASLLRRQACVRLVATLAGLVTLGCSLLLGTVATAASRRLRSRVRLVALRAGLVVGVGEPGFALVTAGAVGLDRLGVVRQALMALRAVLMPLVSGGLVDPFAVTTLASRDAR